MYGDTSLRPSYNEVYGFKDGAQDDIFEGCATNNPPPAVVPPAASPSPTPQPGDPDPVLDPVPDGDITSTSHLPPACTTPAGVRASFLRLKHDAL